MITICRPREATQSTRVGLYDAASDLLSQYHVPYGHYSLAHSET
jgi:hypothetical protein